jgi:TatD DNase family protein
MDMPVWIDTHCHLDAPEFASDLIPVRARARQAGVDLCVWPAVQATDFARVQALARAHGDAYALGIHPMWTPQAQAQDLHALDQALTEAQGDPLLVAVGEIGLDGFVPGLDMARQQHFYRAQLALAQRHGLPVLLHVRRSADALLSGLRQCPVRGGIAHAFNGSRQQADQFIAMGFKLGFGGALTFERALQLRRLATELPLSALVLETDAPDIPPRWLYRTQAERASGASMGRNEPAELVRIAQCLADLRGMAVADLALATSANAWQALPKLGACGPFHPPAQAKA